MTSPPNAGGRDPSRESSDCVAGLRALAAGDLRGWHGLAEGCDRAAVETALGPSETGPDGSGMLGGVPTVFRRYPPAPAAPHGIVVWMESDWIVAVEIVQPALTEPVEAQLGPPEAKEHSGLAAFHSQLIYAARGLTAHVHEYSGAVLRLYGYAPSTVEKFLASPMAKVETRRIPRSR